MHAAVDAACIVACNIETYRFCTVVSYVIVGESVKSAKDHHVRHSARDLSRTSGPHGTARMPYCELEFVVETWPMAELDHGGDVRRVARHDEGGLGRSGVPRDAVSAAGAAHKTMGAVPANKVGTVQRGVVGARSAQIARIER